MANLVVPLGAALVLTAATAIAMDDTKAPAKGKAASGSSASAVAKATSAAPPDIGRHAAVMDMVSGEMKEVRPGTNGWVCMVNPQGDPMCLDKTWQAWGDAWMNKKDPPKPGSVGVAYMLKGDRGASNTDPYATKASADNQWVVTGPHVMILPTEASQLDAYPTDWKQGGPWVMWKGTPYAHIMVPMGAMVKTGAPGKQASK